MLPLPRTRTDITLTLISMVVETTLAVWAFRKWIWRWEA